MECSGSTGVSLMASSCVFSHSRIYRKVAMVKNKREKGEAGAYLW